ncbi:MAG: hypothetical protein LBT53_00520 [Puniceicoccales bacterium]|jgi:hypothetical protein|nr:hypothetical protein [Puniceicoccales bacterium]
MKTTIRLSLFPALAAAFAATLSLAAPADAAPARAAKNRPPPPPAPQSAAFVEQVTGGFAKDRARLFAAIEQHDELLADWLRQDLGDLSGTALFANDKPLENLRRATAKVASDLAKLEAGSTTSTPAASAPATAPVAAATATDISRALADYRRLCLLRRAARLATAAKQTPRLVYARHFVMGGSHYAYTEALSDSRRERNFIPGSRLCLAEFTPEGLWRETVLLESKDGVIRDVDADFDAKRILFSWKKSDRGDDYHLYEIPLAADGRPQPEKIRQLTTGLGVADYEGCYLADGSILFNSTRCTQSVDCWPVDVSNLYRCDADGSRIYRLTFDQVHDNYPSVTWDNRVLYTRWEYNDRSQLYPQPLFQMNADGTNQAAVYGENSWFPTTIIHARAIPGSQDMFAIATGHHSRQPGELILVQPGKGRQETEGVTRVAPVRPHVKKDPVIIDSYGQGGPLFAYPLPLDSRQLLVTHNPVGWRFGRDLRSGFGIYWADIDGNRELLVSRLGIACGRAVPLVARKRPATRASTVDFARDEGTFHILDVYEGEAMKGVPRGTVKTLRVVEIDYRHAAIYRSSSGSYHHQLFNKGDERAATTPITIGDGTWDVKAIVGDAKVWPDGSVFFKAPARRPLYFLLLDDKGRMVQTMRSWTTLQPGENASCVGCHEQKNAAPPVASRPKQALLAGAQRLVPLAGTPPLAAALEKDRRGMSFPKDIQPLLEKHCVACHDGRTRGTTTAATTFPEPILPSGGSAPHAKPRIVPTGYPQNIVPDFRPITIADADAGRIWLRSYLSLTHAARVRLGGRLGGWYGQPEHPVVNWISPASDPTLLKPYTAGSNTSALFKRLDARHCKTITPAEIALLAAWVDLGVPYCGDYTEANIWNPSDKTFHAHYAAKRAAANQADAASKQALQKSH